MRKPPHEVGMMDQPPLRMEKERSVQSRRTRSVRRLQSSLRGPREGHGCDYAFDENAYRGSTARAHERVATWAHTTTIANNAVYRSIGCYRSRQLANAHQVLERDTRSGAREPSETRQATGTQLQQGSQAADLVSERRPRTAVQGSQGQARRALGWTVLRSQGQRQQHGHDTVLERQASHLQQVATQSVH